MKLDQLGLNSTSVLTPYVIPKELQGRKVVNIGDGFILRAIENHIGRFLPAKIFSPRIEPTPEVMSIMLRSPAVILAGANQLNDNFTVWPGLTGEKIREKKIRLIPFGIGIHGEPGKSISLSEQTKDVLRAIHESIEYSSWRCPNTLQFLKQELPELAPQLLMTGCPVVYGRPLLGGAAFKGRTRRVAVTVTERHDFWSRETSIIDFVARTFPRAQRFLVLHQNFSPPQRLEYMRHRWLQKKEVPTNPYAKLRWYAAQRGFRILAPRDSDSAIKWYENIDFHIGSRLHAHLLCLSLAKRSALVPIDERSTGIANAFGFELYNPADLDHIFNFDFETIRTHAIEHYNSMQLFVRSLQLD